MWASGVKASAGFESRISVLRQTDQVITASTWTPVEWSYEFYDNLGEYDHTANWKFVALAAGVYQMKCFVSIKSLGAGKLFQARFTKNGAAPVGAGPIEQSGPAVSGNKTWVKTYNELILAAADYIQVECWHNDVASRSIGEDPCYFWLRRVA